MASIIVAGADGQVSLCSISGDNIVMDVVECGPRIYHTFGVHHYEYELIVARRSLEQRLLSVESTGLNLNVHTLGKALQLCVQDSIKSPSALRHWLEVAQVSYRVISYEDVPTLE